MNNFATDKKIEQFVKHTVHEVFRAEFMKLRALVFPYISAREQLDIEIRYGKKPSRKAVKTFSFQI